MSTRRSRTVRTAKALVVVAFAASASFTLITAFPSIRVFSTTLETAVLSLVTTAILGVVVLLLAVNEYATRAK